MKPCLLAGAAVAIFSAAPLAAQPAPPATRAEVEQRITQRFAARDANHDGFLASDELGESAAMAIAQMDSDHDGKISLAEATAATMAMFARVDTNQDGTISPEERAAAEAQMGQPRPAPEPQPETAQPD